MDDEEYAVDAGDSAVLGDAPALPLQLVAHRLEFEHPVTGEQVRLRSMRKLALLPS